MLASPDGEAVDDGPDEAQQQVPVVKGSICRVVVPDRPRAVNQKADVRLHSTLCAKGGANRDSQLLVIEWAEICHNKKFSSIFYNTPSILIIFIYLRYYYVSYFNKKRKIIQLSNDISNIKLDERKDLKINCEFEK